ncbi:hypothetical protein [Marinagarivorans cellulosilyticus]|uniref:Uncharacterized protein n=1 Tax=Marinagarivorans cellulosilyticus TaxID=2721545 RepID=A0AAN1WG29_9GAMM|nr:hypothetical protein [Marinagarivorans cellulosilyticus]BCD96951.1 hypothetical protein MARGE09_P1151 [Marinagarivorans cellulosilyticus]
MSDNDEKHWKFIISISVTVILAFCGYLYTWNQARNDAQYNAQLERVNSQLKEFYGPLYVLTEAEELSFEQFLKHTRPNQGRAFWNVNNPPNEEQKKAWRQWISAVTIPNYERMELIILQHSDLIIEDDIPKPLLDLSSHIAGYKPVLAAWKGGDYSRNWSFTNFPQEVRSHLKERYVFLKNRQRSLIGLVTASNPNKLMHPTAKAAAD